MTYMHQAVSRLADLVAPRLLRVDVRHSPKRVRDRAEQLVCDKVAARSFLVRAAGRRVRARVRAVGGALVAAGRLAVTMCGREIRVDGCAVCFCASPGLRVIATLRAMRLRTTPWWRRVADAAEMLFEALGFCFAALEGFEQVTLLLEFVFGHVFLYPLENAIFEDSAHDASELCALAHGLCEART